MYKPVTASTQTIGSVFLERVRKEQNSNYEPVLLKVNDVLLMVMDL